MIAVAVLLILILIVIFYVATKEKFATKRDKAEKIYNWFNGNSSHTYSGFRSALDRESNIVEYEDVKKLFDATAKQNFTVGSVEAAI